MHKLNLEKPKKQNHGFAKEHWQMNVNITPKGSDRGGDAFLPRPAKNRPTAHKKINECDY